MMKNKVQHKVIELMVHNKGAEWRSISDGVKLSVPIYLLLAQASSSFPILGKIACLLCQYSKIDIDKARVM